MPPEGAADAITCCSWSARSACIFPPADLLRAAKMPTVAEVSNSRKLAAASRVAGRYAGRSRTVMAALSAVSAVTRSLANVFHRLWHEVMGFFFFVFSLIGALAVYREYRKYSVLTPHPSAGGLIAAGLFTLVFFYFCVSSFWRSRSRNQASGPPREDTGRKK
ncbi:MAG: hypothetical protein DMG67_05120 [Acidobacteria bacterium]|nr:MAG: hypothetical protein DMG67_05120 [Acidobacteriota bacterium]